MNNEKWDAIKLWSQMPQQFCWYQWGLHSWILIIPGYNVSPGEYILFPTTIIVKKRIPETPFGLGNRTSCKNRSSRDSPLQQKVEDERQILHLNQLWVLVRSCMSLWNQDFTSEPIYLQKAFRCVKLHSIKSLDSTWCPTIVC